MNFRRLNDFLSKGEEIINSLEKEKEKRDLNWTCFGMDSAQGIVMGAAERTDGPKESAHRRSVGEGEGKVDGPSGQWCGLVRPPEQLGPRGPGARRKEDRRRVVPTWLPSRGREAIWRSRGAYVAATEVGRERRRGGRVRSSAGSGWSLRRCEPEWQTRRRHRRKRERIEPSARGREARQVAMAQGEHDMKKKKRRRGGGPAARGWSDQLSA